MTNIQLFEKKIAHTSFFSRRRRDAFANPTPFRRKRDILSPCVEPVLDQESWGWWRNRRRQLIHQRHFEGEREREWGNSQMKPATGQERLVWTSNPNLRVFYGCDVIQLWTVGTCEPIRTPRERSKSFVIKAHFTLFENWGEERKEKEKLEKNRTNFFFFFSFFSNHIMKEFF